MVSKSVKEGQRLTDQEKEDIVAEYLGVHPRYFIYEGAKITINNWQFEHDGNRFNGWAPDKK